jgi:hypothetical protein
VTEPQLNDPDVDAVGTHPTRTLVSEVMPPQIDPQQLFTIHSAAPRPVFADDIGSVFNNVRRRCLVFCCE